MASEHEVPLAQVLDGLVMEYGWQRARWISLLQILWKDVAGDNLAQHSRVITLTRDHILLVAVPTSVWAQQLSALKYMVLTQIHQRYADIPVKDIRTRVKVLSTREEEPAASKHSPYYAVGRLSYRDEDPQVLLLRVQEKYELASRDWLSEGFSRCHRCHAPTLTGYDYCVTCELELKHMRL